MKKIFIPLMMILFATATGFAQDKTRTLDVNGSKTTLEKGVTYRFAPEGADQLKFSKEQTAISTNTLPVTITFTSEATTGGTGNPFGGVYPGEFAIKYETTMDIPGMGDLGGLLGTTTTCQTYKGSLARTDIINQSIIIADSEKKTARSYSFATKTWTTIEFKDAEAEGGQYDEDDFAEIKKTGETKILDLVCDVYTVKTKQDNATMKIAVSREYGITMQTEMEATEEGITMTIKMTAKKYTFTVPDKAFSESTLSPDWLD